MSTGWPLLSLLVFSPLGGVLLLLLSAGRPGNTDLRARRIALVSSLVTLGIAILLWHRFDPATGGYQFQEQAEWLGRGVAWRLGVDGISLPFVLLTALLLPACIIASGTVRIRITEYMVAFLVLETLMLGVFVSVDLVLFYLFFEAVLMPMFLIIGIWGGPRRIHAAFKFMLYTLLGSLLMLLAVAAIWLETGTTSIPDIAALAARGSLFGESTQTWLWLAFLASFAVKLPMWPVHTWLPDAHVEAPTAGSVILAGVLLKLGGYGLLRLSLPFFPEASVALAPLVLVLSVIAIIYTSLVALVQEDIKKLIAYSSVAHMGFVTIGIFSFSRQGIEGALFQMVSHGLVSSALFLCAGLLHDRLHTRELARLGGLAAVMPRHAVLFMLFVLASAGLPATSGFVGEFMVLAGAISVSGPVALLAGTGMILGAAYGLRMYGRVMFGTLADERFRTLSDLCPREMAILGLLAFLVLWLGIFPGTLLEIFQVSVPPFPDGGLPGAWNAS